MLKRINPDNSQACVKLHDAAYPAPFHSGLEFSAPARGTWNIVHTGMLIPETHQIFVCAAGCLRGVVLTAAEMHAEERFSTIAIRENNLIDGSMDSLIIDGVSDILSKLPEKPKAVLLYTSCVHHFLGNDLDMIYSSLRRNHPDIAFTDCYMNPIMRKSGLTPDQLMRRQMYSLLEKRPLNSRSVNIIGNNLPTDRSSEFVQLIENNGFHLKEITDCASYSDYQQMAESCLNIVYNPVAVASGRELERRLGQKMLYLPLSFDYNEIERNLGVLANELGLPEPDCENMRADCESALNELKLLVGDMPIAIDYTATLRPFGLARLLCEHGLNVTRIYADSISAEDETDFRKLQKSNPDILVYATVHAEMRADDRHPAESYLAIGQKAAYFTGSSNFVNIVEGGGLLGFDGIKRMCGLISEAYKTEKDAKSLIQIKGLGCGCCI